MLGVKDDLFMTSMFMTFLYLSPLVIFFDQGHKIPNIDIESSKRIKKFIESSERIIPKL